MVDELEDFDHPFENMSLDSSRCFLCGTEMGSNATREDLFPLWLQRKHNLGRQSLYLINGTTIRYSQLKIPCCNQCNNNHLSQLENKVSLAFNSGYQACLELEPNLLFYWGAKIFYGILRKELSLLRDRSIPSQGSIVPESFLHGYKNLHTFMQGIRRPMVFSEPLPFSILVANLHDLGSDNNYSFKDDIFRQTLSIRSGEVGIIIAIADASVNRYSYSRYLEEVNGRKLHPIQFDELFAKVTYQCSRLRETPFLTVVANKDRTVPIRIICKHPREPILEEWDYEEFAQLLKKCLTEWGVSDEILFFPPNIVSTFMQNCNGSLMFMNRDAVFR